MRQAAIGAALIVAACSPAAEAPPAEKAASEAVAPVAAATAPAAPIGSSLRADVSGLSGDVSGLSVQTTEFGTVVALDADILFDFDKATLRPDATAQLMKTADLIRAGGEGAIEVTGFTDAKGGDAYNLDLSKRRAAAVVAWFGGQVGVRQRQFTPIGKGEAEPVAPNTLPDGADNPAGRAKNRRVEILIPRA